VGNIEGAKTLKKKALIQLLLLKRGRSWEDFSEKKKKVWGERGRKGGKWGGTI